MAKELLTHALLQAFFLSLFVLSLVTLKPGDRKAALMVVLWGFSLPGWIAVSACLGLAGVALLNLDDWLG